MTTDDGAALHVEIDEPDGWQGGPTILFTHGYCLALGSWIHQRRAVVDAGYRCVTWDQRGHGRSGVGDDDHLRLPREAQLQPGALHLAAEVGVGQSMYEVERYTSVNDVGTAVLFVAATDTS